MIRQPKSFCKGIKMSRRLKNFYIVCQYENLHFKAKIKRNGPSFSNKQKVPKYLRCKHKNSSRLTIIEIYEMTYYMLFIFQNQLKKIKAQYITT